MLLILHELLGADLWVVAPILKRVQHMRLLLRHSLLHELQELFCDNARLPITQHRLHHLVHLAEGHF